MSEIIRLAQVRLYRRWGRRLVKAVLFGFVMYILVMGLTTIIRVGVEAQINHEAVTQRVTGGHG